MMKRKQQQTPSEQTRKKRNCAAQKAYRQRQQLYIKQLEERLEGTGKSDQERFSELHDNVSKYRTQLLAAYKKLESTRISLQNVLDDVAAALDMNERPQRCTCSHARPASEGPIETALPSFPEDDSTGISAAEPLDASLTTTTSSDSSPSSVEILNMDHSGIFEDLENTSADLLPVINPHQHNGVSDLDTSHIDEVVNGLNTLDGTAWAMMMAPKLTLPRPLQIDALQSSNSPFSDHITMFQSLLRTKMGWLQIRSGDANALIKGVAYMLISNFVHTCWPALSAFMAYTNAYGPVAKVTTWSAAPDALTYADLDSNYRPTGLQLSMAHPSVIDWVPFPALRDLLIMRYQDSPSLDDVVCEIADSYCCEADLSALVSEYKYPCSGYVRVNDIISVMNSNWTLSLGRSLAAAAGFSTTPTSSNAALPAPTTTALFTSEKYAAAAYQLMGMGKGLAATRLDPRFFERHPELYDPSVASLIATGIALRPPSSVAFPPAPKPVVLDPRILSNYETIVLSAIQVQSG